MFGPAFGGLLLTTTFENDPDRQLCTGFSTYCHLDGPPATSMVEPETRLPRLQCDRVHPHSVGRLGGPTGSRRGPPNLKWVCGLSKGGPRWGDKGGVGGAALSGHRARAVRLLGHQPVLDGVRALAFLAVFFGHAGLAPELAAGQVAMFVFFGLSGFLITALLCGEKDLHGRISLVNFYLRRTLRLCRRWWPFFSSGFWWLSPSVMTHG